MFAIRQSKPVETVAPVLSVTVRVTVLVPVVVGTPEISPVSLMVRPSGRPVASYVRPAPELVV